MRLLLFTVLTLTLTLIMADTKKDDTPAICDDGWLHDVDSRRCYHFHNGYETMTQATATCTLFGAQVAFASTQKAVDSLKKLVGQNTTYGWWYGERYRVNTYPKPKYTRHVAPSSGCVAMGPFRPVVTSVGCKTTLPYVCRGDPNSVQSNSAHYAKRKGSASDMYWFSSPTDRRNFQDASYACKEKTMTLLSIRSVTERKFIIQELLKRSLRDVDPWWIGLIVKDGSLKWSNGVLLVAGVLDWQYSSRIGSNSYLWQNLLLRDGTLETVKRTDNVNAPFICMRRESVQGSFGCPHTWSRGDQSCYKVVLRSGTKEKAESLCSKMDSHILTVNTEMEKTWMTLNILPRYGPYWTTLYATKKNGSFAWPDGSKQKIWGSALGGYGRCVYVSFRSEVLRRYPCSQFGLPGCQYKSSNGECVSSNWFYMNKNCYYHPTNTMSRSGYTSYDAMIHFCREDVAKYDDTIIPTPLKLDSKALLNKLKSWSLRSIWTGLKINVDGQFQWTDGTSLDTSIISFKSPSVKGNPRCAVMDTGGSFYKVSCNVPYIYTVCEKEIPYNPSGAVPMTSRLGTQLMMTVCIVLVYTFI